MSCEPNALKLVWSDSVIVWLLASQAYLRMYTLIQYEAHLNNLKNEL